MTGARSYDAIVICAGVNGLAAASYLAMAGKRVLVVEARETLGGMSETASFGDGLSFSKAAHALYALDPRVIKDLKLARHGLKFVTRDLPLVGLRSDGRHVVLTRDAEASARRIGVHSDADAQAWPQFRRAWFALAREMRSLWWQTRQNDVKRIGESERVQRLARMSTAAWLDSAFESDALKATLGFDGHALSPLAAGSALLLVWRAAQEMSGLQGAVATPRNGMRTVGDAFAAAAQSVGAEMQTGARVTDITVDGEGRAAGVVLESGETVAGRQVLSSLSRRRTLAFPSVRATLGLGARLAHENRGSYVARVTLALDIYPAIAGAPGVARFVVADRLESLAAAHAAAYAGRMPQELTMEAIVPAAGDPALAPTGHHIVSVLVAPVPEKIEGGWREAKSALAAKVVAALGAFIPGLGRHLIGAEVLTPEDVQDIYGADDAYGGPVDVARLLADWRIRVRTPVVGLIFCGAAADPIGSVSGRGGRMAAAFALEQEIAS
jgi:phytoene dehydrogenase-like protein